jgi:hypothetical protein
MKSGIVSYSVKTLIPPTNKKTMPMAIPRLRFSLNSRRRTSGLRMNAASVEMISMSTRSGKNDTIQKRKIISPRNAMTLRNGLFDGEADPGIG